jgi:hypothetical protein
MSPTSSFMHENFVLFYDVEDFVLSGKFEMRKFRLRIRFVVYYNKIMFLTAALSVATYAPR